MLPLGLLIGGLAAVIGTLLVFAAREQDQLAERAGRHLALSALGSESTLVSGYTRDYAVWDDAVENVVLHLNEAWANDNIGNWAHDSLKIDATLVVDGDNQPIYGMIDGVRVERDVSDRITHGTADLIAVVRAAGHSTDGTVVSGYVMIDGVMAIAAASPIIWQDGRPATDRGDAATVLIYMRALNSEMLRSLEDRFLLSGLQVMSADAPTVDTDIPIATVSGVVLGRLAWKPERPGLSTLRPLAIPGAIALLIFGGLLSVVVRKAHRAMHDLEASHHALHVQADSLAAARDRAEAQQVLEAQLRAQADSASRSKSEFLALVSHELRTPLNAILGFSEIIAQQTFGPSTADRAQSYARDINESGNHLLSLINDILDLSKIEAGRYELMEETFVLRDVLDRCATLLRERVAEKNIGLTCHGTSICLNADRRAVMQVVINLLSNAVKFTSPRGRVELFATVAHDAIEIAVSDTGVGMSHEDLQRSLQPFGQADSLHTRSSGGTGLGLNIAEMLTKLHGGSLGLRSTLGEGTVATIRLPLNRLRASAASS